MDTPNFQLSTPSIQSSPAVVPRRPLSSIASSPRTQPGQVPYLDRIHKISERLNSLQSDIENEKLNKIDSLSLRIKQSDDRITQQHEQSLKHVNQVREMIGRVTEKINQQKEQRENGIVGLECSIQKVQSDITEDIKFLQAEILREESRVAVLVDEKIAVVKESMVKDGESVRDLLLRLKKYEADITDLKMEISNEMQTRRESEEALVDQVQNALSQLNDRLYEERSAREEAEQRIFTVIEDFSKKFEDRIIMERRDREISEESLVAVIENVVSRLGGPSQN
jgi:uncharacterized phage infection (PIP) family protein YhgE